MKEFCPKCGSTEGPFFEGFCKKCFLEDHEIISIPSELKVKKCARCKKIRLQGRWVDQSPESLSRLFDKKIKIKKLTNSKMEIDLFREKKNEYRAKIRVLGELNGKKLETQKESRLWFERIICPACGKLASGYFEAIIQIRFDKEKNERKAKRILSKAEKRIKEEYSSDPLSAIVRKQVLSNGFDLYIGSRKAASKAVSRIKKGFSVKVIRSKKLVGAKGGKKRYRFTYSVRV